MKYDRFTFNTMNFRYGVIQEVLCSSQTVYVRFNYKGVDIKAFSKKIMPDSDLPVIRVIETLDLEAYSFTEDCLAPMMGACEPIEIENKQIEFTKSIEYERILSNEYEFLKSINHPKHKLFEKVNEYNAYYNKVKFLDDFEAAILQIKKMVHEENHRQYKLKLKYNIK